MNLFWPTYKRLEREIVSMTSSIRFDDYQLMTYSDKFLELLIRISVEIEAISKELYLKNSGEQFKSESEMYFDTVCLQHLEEKWNLSSKCVLIDGVEFPFEEDDNKILTPLKKANKRGTSGAKWKWAYQSVKHNRSKNFKMGNMKNCIHALAALYILNVYFRDEEYYLKSLKEVNDFDQTLGSSIFSIVISRASSFNGKIDVDEQSVYCINYTDDFVDEWNNKQKELNAFLYKELLNDKKITDAIAMGVLKLEEIGDIERVQNTVGVETFTKALKKALVRNNINGLIQNQEFIAYLNKEN